MEKFCKSLGATDEEIDTHQPSLAIKNVIHTFRNICQNSGTAEGIAALYAYESQIPPICISKIKGLKEHYGMKNPEDWKYFRYILQLMKNMQRQNESFKQICWRRKSKSSHRISPKSPGCSLGFLSSLCDRYNLCSAQM